MHLALLTTILLATTGRDEGDDFGSGLAVLGDVDGDGTDDFAVSDPWREDPDRGEGWIALVSGESREILWQVWGAPDPGGEPSGEFGNSLFPLGDVDGDGVPDLAEWGWWSKPLTVLSGASGARLLEVPGRTVASAGDVDGDGQCDLLVGQRAVTVNDAGAILGVVRSGADGTILRSLSVPATVRSSGAIRAVALDDIDGDGKPDWGLSTGRRLVVFRAEDGAPMPAEYGARLLAVAGPISPGSGPFATIEEEEERAIRLVLRPISSEDAETTSDLIRRHGLRGPSDLATPWGLALENLGDVDSDGADDYLVGLNPGSLIEGVAPGVWSGSGSGNLWRYREPYEICRTRAMGIGDLDGDGRRDVLVSGFWSTGGPPVTGWVEALSGKTGRRLFKLTRADLEP